MKPDQFKGSTAGNCILTDRDYWAFIPNPLPPPIEIDWRLADVLSEADRALSELSGVGRLLPNPYLLINPYVRKEAVLSSRIEGTQASLSDLFYFEAEEPESPSVPDVREVHNYVLAMNHGLERLKTLPISNRLVREIHAVLMEGVRGGAATPGEFRRSQNWIGPPGCTLKEATFVPPPPTEMNQALTEWEKFLHAPTELPPLIVCALMHYQFEAIHPFLDGNGRVGRLLITFFLCERNHLSEPLLYLSDYFERTRSDYYRHLLEVSQSGTWRAWLEYFLKGVALQAKDACETATRLMDLHQKYRTQVGTKRVPAAAYQLVDQIFITPVLSIAKLAREWKMSYPKVTRGIERLVKIGILKEVTGQRRNRLFAADQLIRLLTREK